MTGNQVKGKSFRGALRYNLAKVGKDKAEILDHSFMNASEKTIMKEIQMVRILRPELKKYFYHTSINFPPGEDLSNEMMKQIGLDYLAANGFTQHQYIMFRHKDADHPHIHILVNRIGYDGTVVSDSNDYARSEKVHAIGQSEREAGAVVNTILQIPKVFSLGTLLDGRNGGGDLGPSNQSPADDAMKKKRKKKRRRGLRM